MCYAAHPLFGRVPPIDNQCSFDSLVHTLELICVALERLRLIIPFPILCGMQKAYMDPREKTGCERSLVVGVKGDQGRTPELPGLNYNILQWFVLEWMSLVSLVDE